MTLSKNRWSSKAAALAFGLLMAPKSALASEPNAAFEAMQQELATLREEVRALRAAMVVAAPAPSTGQAATPPMPGSSASASDVVAMASPRTLTTARAKPWYDKLQVRGYVQVRQNEQVGGERNAAVGASRLRSVHDAGFGEAGNFSLRRARLVVQGDASPLMSVYVQGDLAAAVSNQSNGERREHFMQLRDAYADFHFAGRRLKLRVGQSKVPFGWENLQSSSNRIAIDRADATNSAVPGERDLGVAAYFTPASVQAIWDELAADRHKLFGNYGAIGLGLFNGQGTNRTEKNDGLMKVAMVSWPFRLDGLGRALRGQVIELGAQGLLNAVQPELRSGGTSPVPFAEKRVNLHAVLYPNPIGFQTEWTWGHAPAWDRSAQGLAESPLHGGYVQLMARIDYSAKGQILPYVRWQKYDGGWKAANNSPGISTREIEAGIEWQPVKEVELTVAYVSTRRSEADERRTGVARGRLIRTQLQFNY